MTAPSPTPIIAFASGKGGVGKTSLCLNMALALANQGKKVLVFDGDFGLANVDVQLGIAPTKDLSHVIVGQAELADVILKSERGFYVVPGRSGHEKLPFMSSLERHQVLKKLRELSGSFDVVLIDVAAGVDDDVLGIAQFADRTVLVVSPDPSSITDAYAVIKLSKLRHGICKMEVLVNQAGSDMEGKQVFTKIAEAAKKFLQLDVPLIGIVPYDRDYANAVKLQKLLLTAYPNARAAVKITEVAGRLLNANR